MHLVRVLYAPLPMRFYNASRQLLFTPILALTLSLFLVNRGGFAQKLTPLDTTAYTVVEHQPEFPGGWPGLKDYLRKNVKYPAEAQKAGIKGRVFVSFVVERDGSLTDVRVVRGGWIMAVTKKRFRLLRL